MKNKLLVVGTVAFDDIETPSGESGKILGGAATYIGLAASQLSVDAAIVSVVGGDFPEDYLSLLRERNLNLEGLKVEPSGKTFYWKGKYHKNLNKRDTLVTELNVLADFSPEVPSDYKDAEIVLLGNLHPAVQLSVLDQLGTSPKTVVLDTMNFWMDNTWDDLLLAVAQTDIITINDEEALQLSGENSLVAAAKKIHSMGPSYVVIKKGEHGALMFHQDTIFFAPALPIERVVDPTGAGDSFAGGLAAYLSSGVELTPESVKTGIIYGSALASFCVTDFGTSALLNLDKSALKKRLSAFKALVHFDEN
jgi:sugar/nucleoside kinase (ribokinase family)